MSPYEVLGISAVASKDEIKDVFRKLARIYHPDSGNPYADNEKFIKITDAYNYLMKNSIDHSIGITINDIMIISVKESIVGFSKNYSINKQVPCDCGSMRIKCLKCHGSKYIKRGLSMKVRCDRCGGYGFENPRNCIKCHGSGEKSIIESIKIKSESVINDGELRTFKYSKGDLNIEFIIKKSEQDIYDRLNNDLIYEAKISPLDQILGTTLYIPRVNQDSVKLQIKENIRIPSYFKIENSGVPGTNGNLIVQLNIDSRLMDLNLIPIIRAAVNRNGKC